MTHPLLASLARLSADNDVWEGSLELAGRRIALDLTNDEDASKKQLDKAGAFTKDLARFDRAARAAILENLEDGEAAELFAEHHLSELLPATLNSLFGTSRRSDLLPDQVLERLVLRRVGLYPASDDEAAVFDYELPGDVSNYILVVSFDAEGTVTSVEMES